MSSKAPIHDPIWKAVDALQDASSWLQQWDVGQVEAALDEAIAYVNNARRALEASDEYAADQEPSADSGNASRKEP